MRAVQWTRANWKGKMQRMSQPVHRRSPAPVADFRGTTGPPASTSHREFDPNPYRFSVVVLCGFDCHKLCVDLANLSNLIALRVMFS